MGNFQSQPVTTASTDYSAIREQFKALASIISQYQRLQVSPHEATISRGLVAADPPRMTLWAADRLLITCSTCSLLHAVLWSVKNSDAPKLCVTHQVSMHSVVSLRTPAAYHLYGAHDSRLCNDYPFCGKSPLPSKHVLMQALNAMAMLI